MNLKTVLVLIASTTNALVSSTMAIATDTPIAAPITSNVTSVTQALAPARQGTLRYFMSESSSTKTAGSRMVASRYQEICQGEVKIPVFDMTQTHGGTSLKPQQIKCKVDTDSGPMEVVTGSYITLRNYPSADDNKTPTENKVLDISFGLSQEEGNRTKRISNNYFSTRTQDISQSEMDLQIQTDLILAKIGENDVTDSFSIRFEFVDDELKLAPKIDGGA